MDFHKKILIVDDIELNRAILGELFHDRYEIIEAENGVQALELLDEHGEAIAALLLDIVMPIMDGFGVLKELPARGWAGRIPVVMITSETSVNVMQRAYEMGAADIISKPFSPNVIRQRINNLVEQYTYKLHLENLVEQQTAALRDQARKLRENSAQMIDILSAVIEFKNAESVGHIHNIRLLTRLLMRELSIQHSEYGLTSDMIEMISEAAAMHDIGKVAIPDHILNKPGRLTSEEFEIMKTHSLRGCEILEKLSNVQYLDYYDYCYEICRHHHERWDGLGYPDGLVGDETPIWAQVVSLADVYDALTSKRVYKSAYSCERAVEMIVMGECGTFNPILINCFMSIVPFLKDSGKLEILPIKSVESALSPAEPPKRKWAADDVSARTLSLLELERQKYRVLSELSGEILFDYEFKTDKLVFSEKYQEMTGKDLVVPHLQERLRDRALIETEDYTRLLRGLEKITANSPICRVELRLKLTEQGFSWYEMYLCPIWDTDYEGSCIGYMGKLINIDKQKQETRQLQHAADSDPLTGILNRNALCKQISELFSDGQTTHAALCFIDIDNFKLINDNFGHQFGDGVLKHVASVLRSCARKTDLIGRIGGDEFAVFFQGLTDGPELKSKLSAICTSLCKSFDGYSLSGSVGASCFPQDGQDFDSLLQRADQALYLSKQQGKNQYQVYRQNYGAMSFRSHQSGVDG